MDNQVKTVVPNYVRRGKKTEVLITAILSSHYQEILAVSITPILSSHYQEIQAAEW